MREVLQNATVTKWDVTHNSIKSLESIINFDQGSMAFVKFLAFGSFMMKKYVMFNLRSFGTEEH